MMKALLTVIATLAIVSCGGTRKSSNTDDKITSVPVGLTFSADSAFEYCLQQCSFGPRTMNSEAHEACARWIVNKFEQMGLSVTEQRATLDGYDGTPLLSNNIIASYRPEAPQRLLICAHWDSRPWADNDPNEENWHKPVTAANDGASGVAVMLELARLLSSEQPTDSDSIALSPNLGVDFICFDAEDWGTPQWSDAPDASDSWALGAQYWAANPHRNNYQARYGILLDMVGGQGARFYREGYSRHYASDVVDRVWKAAQVVGYGSLFPQEDGNAITDDHVPVNQIARIPCIDIIPYYPNCPESSFGPTWHTVNDDMQHIDRNTLKAVGQTLVQVLFTEK